MPFMEGAQLILTASLVRHQPTDGMRCTAIGTPTREAPTTTPRISKMKPVSKLKSSRQRRVAAETCCTVGRFCGALGSGIRLEYRAEIEQEIKDRRGRPGTDLGVRNPRGVAP